MKKKQIIPHRLGACGFKIFDTPCYVKTNQTHERSTSLIIKIVFMISKLMEQGFVQKTISPLFCVILVCTESVIKELASEQLLYLKLKLYIVSKLPACSFILFDFKYSLSFLETNIK